MAISEALMTLAPYAIQALPGVLTAMSQIGAQVAGKYGSTSGAKSQQAQQTNIANNTTDSSGSYATSGSSTEQGNVSSNQYTQGQTTQQQSSVSAGESSQTGNTAGIANALQTAMGTATGNNAAQAASFNAGQATTANNLQSGMWSLANLMNIGSQAASAMLTAKSQTSAKEYNSAEAQKNRDWQTTMSNTAYQRQVNDLKAAGLNPILAAFSGGGASTPSGGYGTVSGQTFSHTSAASIPAAHTANMQSMYDYGNNTAQFLENAMAVINSAKQTGHYETASTMENIMNNVQTTSANTVSQISKTMQENGSNANHSHSTDTSQSKTSNSEKTSNKYKEGQVTGNIGNSQGATWK